MPACHETLVALRRMAAAGGTAVTARRVAETAARIFGNVLGDGLRSGRKYLQKALVGDKVKNYYPQFSQFATSYDPMLDDPEEKQCVPLVEGRAVEPAWACVELSSQALTPVLRPCPLLFSRKLKLERLKRRGKGPPKKGEGKRASKR